MIAPAPRRGRGRPALPPEERRTETLDGVRVSPAELTALTTYCTRLGVTVADGVREAIRRWMEEK